MLLPVQALAMPSSGSRAGLRRLCSEQLRLGSEAESWSSDSSSSSRGESGDSSDEEASEHGLGGAAGAEPAHADVDKAK
eukprot:4998456-Heterocapsa_arctica.AAC.1